MSLEPPATGISCYLVVEEIMSGRVDFLAELRDSKGDAFGDAVVNF
jgi:hypothetical protein